MRTSTNVKNVSAALVAAQAKFEIAFKNDYNNFFDSSFANFESIVTSVRKILHENKLAFLQFTRASAPGENSDVLCYIVTRIIHDSGEWMEGDFPVVLRQEPSEKADARAFGSEDDEPKNDKKKRRNLNQEISTSVTYLKRVALQTALGVVTSDDDDGNDSSQVVSKADAAKSSSAIAKPGRVSKIVRAYAKLSVTKEMIAKFCGIAAVEQMTELQASDLWKIGTEIEEGKKTVRQVFK